MKAIVIVFMPGSAYQPVAEETATRPVANLFPAIPTLPAAPDSSQATAPFWTWFIENPRAGEPLAI